MDILENHFPSYDNLYIILFDKYTKAVPIQLILWDVFYYIILIIWNILAMFLLLILMYH